MGTEDDVLETVVELLTSDAAPTLTSSLLQTLHDLGTVQGAQTLHDVGIELGIDRTDWPDRIEDLAVEVWLRAAGDQTYERALGIAEVAIHERASETHFREYAGEAAVARVPPGEASPILRDGLRDWFRSEGMGSAVMVKVRVEERRTVYCVFHGGRFQREATVDDDGHEAVLGFRPLTCDVMVHEQETGRLRVTARSKRVAEAYRKAMGRALYGEPEFFAERPLYTLGPIAEAIGSGSLPPPPFGLGIQSVTLVACRWAIGDAVQVSVRGLRARECIVEAQRSGFHRAQANLTEAKLAFVFADRGRPQRVDVVVRDGNRVNCNRAVHRDSVDHYLASIGVKDQAAAAQAESGAPAQWTGIQSAASWRQLLGEELQAAVDNGLLVRRDRPLIAAEGAPANVGTEPAVAIDSANDSTVLVLSDDSISIVGAAALAGYELNAERLGERIRRELACERSLSRLPIDGAFDLGPLVIGSVRVRPFLFTRPVRDSAAVERALRELAGPDRPLLSIHLPGTNTETWTCALPLQSLVTARGLRRAIVHLLRLEGQVQALELANEERLVVDPVNHVSWLDGVRLELADSERLTLEVLAIAWSKGQSVAAADLGGAAGTSDAGRQRISALKKAVKKAFVGKESPQIVTNTRKGEGYRLALRPYVAVAVAT